MGKILLVFFINIALSSHSWAGTSISRTAADAVLTREQMEKSRNAFTRLWNRLTTTLGFKSLDRYCQSVGSFFRDKDQFLVEMRRGSFQANYDFYNFYDALVYADRLGEGGKDFASESLRLMIALTQMRRNLATIDGRLYVETENQLNQIILQHPHEMMATLLPGGRLENVHQSATHYFFENASLHGLGGDKKFYFSEMTPERISALRESLLPQEGGTMALVASGSFPYSQDMRGSSFHQRAQRLFFEAFGKAIDTIYFESAIFDNPVLHPISEHALLNGLRSVGSNSQITNFSIRNSNVQSRPLEIYLPNLHFPNLRSLDLSGTKYFRMETDHNGGGLDVPISGRIRHNYVNLSLYEMIGFLFEGDTPPQHLRELDLSNTALSYLGGRNTLSYRTLQSLNILKLAGNKIAEVSVEQLLQDVRGGWKNLRVLDLREVPLTAAQRERVAQINAETETFVVIDSH